MSCIGASLNIFSLCSVSQHASAQCHKGDFDRRERGEREEPVVLGQSARYSFKPERSTGCFSKCQSHFWLWTNSLMDHCTQCWRALGGSGENESESPNKKTHKTLFHFVKKHRNTPLLAYTRPDFTQWFDSFSVFFFLFIGPRLCEIQRDDSWIEVQPQLNAEPEGWQWRAEVLGYAQISINAMFWQDRNGNTIRMQTMEVLIGGNVDKEFSVQTWNSCSSDHFFCLEYQKKYMLIWKIIV